jgi:hypothetical protein
MTAPVSTSTTASATSVDFAVSIDPGLAFLHRAHARLLLVEAGEMDIETAIDGLIPAMLELIGPCHCSRDIVERWERDCPPVPPPTPKPRPTPQTTVEAIMFGVRKRGVAALKERANIERLNTCDAAAKAQIDRRIAKLISAKEIVGA